MLSQLSPENLEKVLAHDRWKTEAILENNLQIEEMRNSLLSGSERGTNFTQDDIDFNQYSSYSKCNDSQVGKLSKIKVKQGAQKASQDMLKDLLVSMASDVNYSTIPQEDKREVLIKGLLTNTLHYALSIARIKRWPDAKDKSSLAYIKKDFEDNCMRFKPLVLEMFYDSFALVWPTYFEKIELSIIDTELGEIVQKACSKMEERGKKSDIKSSPMFLKIIEEFPSITPSALEHYYVAMSGKYIEAALRVLTLDFIQNRPPELDYTDQFAEWSDTYVNHLNNYKETWKNKLKEIETDTWDEQIKWNKALTS